MNRLFFAIRCFFRALSNKEFAEKVQGLDAPEEIETQEEEETLSLDITQLLALFQKEGRLIDFLKEDVHDFEDAQIGAAVRSVHKGCRKVLDEYIKLEPVMQEKEGSVVTIYAGFDPSTVTLVGEISGDPPFRGPLVHPGWRVSKTELPEISEDQDQTVVAKAEVEVR